jgi:hypothetical protein
VRQALDALPATLDDTYTRILLDIEEMYHDHALTLLRWLAYARSPPTLGELVDAAVTEPCHESSIDADNRGGLEDTLNILSGLVMVEDSKDADTEDHSKSKSSTSDASTTDHDQADVASHSRHLTSDTRVRLAHFSVKEYLESRRILQSGAGQFYLESAAGHRALSQSCLTYLRYYSISPEKTLTKQDLETFPLLRYAARSWFYHSALQCGGETSREVSLLQSGPARDDWLLLYAPETSKAGPFQTGEEDKGTPPASAIYYASILGLPVVVASLLGGGADVNGRGNKRFGNPLQAAVGRGGKETLQLLLDNGADVNAKGGLFGNVLQLASMGHDKEIVQLLLDNGANVNADGGYFGNAHYAASFGGNCKEIKQLLLDNGAIVNSEGGWHPGSARARAREAREAASAGGHEDAV